MSNAPLDQSGVWRYREFLPFLDDYSCVVSLREGNTPLLDAPRAAEYAGHPSPVFRARLDHAYDLFKSGLAPVVITTGGAASDPSFSEGGVGRDYLIHRGIPERSLIAETLGSDTAQSAERVGVILRANNMQSCLAVSDEYHVFRIKALLRREGVQVYVAPRAGSRPRSAWQRMAAVTREAMSYLVWKLNIPV